MKEARLLPQLADQVVEYLVLDMADGEDVPIGASRTDE